jgi:Uma2 family endonuclease
MMLDLEPPFVMTKPVADESEYYALGEDSPWELLDGRLVMSPASDRHEDLFRFLLILLGGWLDERGGAVVRGSRYPMRLDAEWSPEPDLLVVTDEHRRRMRSERLDGPADLVIEIASDGDPRFDEREKLPRYRAAAIPEIWLVSPQGRHIRVDQREAAGDYRTNLRRDGQLDTTVLPGFWLDVSWLWQEPLPSALGCLHGILSDNPA